MNGAGSARKPPERKHSSVPCCRVKLALVFTLVNCVRIEGAVALSPDFQVTRLDSKCPEHSHVPVIRARSAKDGPTCANM